MLSEVKEVSKEFLQEIKKTIRVASDETNAEVEDLINAAVQDMEMSGVMWKGESDPLSRQAVKLYCKGNYGYDDNTERFQKSYSALRDSMALSGEYVGEKNG